MGNWESCFDYKMTSISSLTLDSVHVSHAAQDTVCVYEWKPSECKESMRQGHDNLEKVGRGNASNGCFKMPCNLWLAPTTPLCSRNTV